MLGFACYIRLLRHALTRGIKGTKGTLNTSNLTQDESQKNTGLTKLAVMPIGQRSCHITQRIESKKARCNAKASLLEV